MEKRNNQNWEDLSNLFEHKKYLLLRGTTQYLQGQAWATFCAVPVFTCNLISVFSMSLFIADLRIKFDLWSKTFVTQFNIVFDRDLRNDLVFVFKSV